MTKIQIVLLFTSIAKLESAQRTRLEEIVRSAWLRVYGDRVEDVETVLCDGKSEGNKNDIVLVFSGDGRRLNEGALRGEVRREVAARLQLLFPKSMGFHGNVATREGELPMPPNASAPEDDSKSAEDAENDYHARAQNYQAEDPAYSFDMVKLPAETLEQIDQALARIELEREVFDEWGLYAIMPNPVSAMSFFGPPGTGKTLAASAIAHRLGRKIIRASYADIESKYHGEGPKNVCALFLAAEQQDAVLFIDEADSLLSKRLTNVSQGSEQAINSMRSQLLICLENFHGIVMFATNLVVNYDRAFLSRLINIRFELPDPQMRAEIWDAHLRPGDTGTHRLAIPLADDVDTAALGADYAVCGRNIRNAVVNACVEARRRKQSEVTQDGLRRAIANEMVRDENALTAEDHSANAVRLGLKDALENMVNEDTPVRSLTEQEGDSQ